MATRVATLLGVLLGRFLPDFKAAPKGGFFVFSAALILPSMTRLLRPSLPNTDVRHGGEFCTTVWR